MRWVIALGDVPGHYVMADSLPALPDPACVQGRVRGKSERYWPESVGEMTVYLRNLVTLTEEVGHPLPLSQNLDFTMQADYCATGP